MSNNDSSVKNPIEMGSLANTVIRKSRCLSKPVDMFVCRYSLSLTWALNSLRLRKNVITIQWNSAMNSTLDISLFICYLFMMHSQGFLHFPSHGINFNHDSWNSFLSNHNSQSTKKKTEDSVTKISLLPPLREIYLWKQWYHTKRITMDPQFDDHKYNKN